MKRYDVFEFNDPGGAEALLVIQDEFYNDLETIVVVPVFPEVTKLRIQTINPVLKVNRATCFMKTEFMGAVPREILVKKLANIDDQAFTIRNAIDRLLTGI